MISIALALNLEERLAGRTVGISVVGREDLCLPVAEAFADRRFRVQVVDLEEERGGAPVREHIHVLPARPRGRRALPRHRDTFSRTPAPWAVEVAVICAPVPFDGQRYDTGPVVEAARYVAVRLRAGWLVLLRSEGYPGMTDQVVRPILESMALRVGKEIFLAAAPLGGSRSTGFGLDRETVVVGGSDRISTRLASGLMLQVSSRVISVSSPGTAEMTRLVQHTFRSVNSALGSQLAQVCDRMSMDAWEVTRAAAFEDLGAAHLPRGLLSRDCAPRDPAYFSAMACAGRLNLVDVAAQVHEQTPQYFVDRLLGMLAGPGREPGSLRVLVLGMPCGGGRDQACFCPARQVLDLLLMRNAEVTYYDPRVPEISLPGGGTLRSLPLPGDLVGEADCVLVLDDHPCLDLEAAVRDAHLVVDTCNATGGLTAGRGKIVRL